MKYHSAIVCDILMHDRHSYINQHVLTEWTDEQFEQHLPAMKKSVTLIKMVFTAITTATLRKSTSDL
jgi:hypothetical protein